MNAVEIIEKEIGRGWVARKLTSATLSGITADVDAAAGTVTRSSGSWISDGLAVGDIITFTGFADAENNVAFTVTAVTALVVTGTTAAAMKNVAGDSGVGGGIRTKAVTASRCRMGILKVLTGSITVTPKNDTEAVWDGVASTADLEIQPCPIEIGSALKLTFSADGSAWVLYK